MKLRIPFAIASLTLLISCTIESELALDQTKITRITAGDGNSVASDSKATTRTTLNDFKVHWTTGDRLGIMNIADPTTNRRFNVSSDQGYLENGTQYGLNTDWAYFDANDPVNGALEAGVWVAFYPWKSNRASAWTYTNMVQLEPNNQHISKLDFLVSSPTSVANGEVNGAFRMDHIASLIEVKIKLDKYPYTIYDEDEDEDIKQKVTLLSCAIDGETSNCFAQSVYFDDQAEIQVKDKASTITLTVDNSLTLTKEYTTVWFLVRQLVPEKLNLRIPIKIGTFTTSPAPSIRINSNNLLLTPGEKYSISVEMGFTDPDYNPTGSGTIRITEKNGIPVE